MDDVLEFCRRVLGPGEPAHMAAAQARASGAGERVELLTHASEACRRRAELAAPPPTVAAESGNGPVGLTQAVSRELAAANARLPERHREALVLRELLGLSHEQIAAVMGLEPAAVGPLMARARLKLRTELRGPMPPSAADCADSEKALAALARRQDAEPRASDDDEWLLSHLAGCEPCDRAHAAMLEASVCYGAWRPEPVPMPS
jgi:hypothetical protein